MRFYFYSFVVQHEIVDGDISRSSFIVQYCFFHMKLKLLRVVLSASIKNCVVILMVINLNL